MKEEPAEVPSWYCLKSQPKHEHIAAAHLRQMRNVEVFCPRLRFKRATKRGPVWFEEAMFPGYLFAHFNFPERHKEVRYAAGVSSILRFGQRYVRLDEETIRGLRSKTNENQLAIIKNDIRQGDTVTIIEGALCGLEAVVTQFLSGRERVRVLLNFLGREMHAEVSTPGVLPATRHPLAA
jgi:transcriptional antiterminator RfaH